MAPICTCSVASLVRRFTRGPLSGDAADEHRLVLARRPALVVRLWLVVLCGYLALGATLQVLPGFLTHRYSTGPVLIVLVISVAWLAAAALQARRRCQRN